MKDPVSARAKQLDFIIVKLMDKKTFFITIGLASSDLDSDGPVVEIL